jgi:hypothetical protein
MPANLSSRTKFKGPLNAEAKSLIPAVFSMMLSLLVSIYLCFNLAMQLFTIFALFRLSGFSLHLPGLPFVSFVLLRVIDTHLWSVNTPLPLTLSPLPGSASLLSRG